MTGFAGTGQLTKLALRRDVGILPACTFGVVAVVALVARDLADLYPTAARRLALARVAETNATLRFLYGRLNGTSVGALTAWRFDVWAACAAALLTIFIVIRHTRADEEAGRLELVGSAAVGRQAPLTAALLAAATAAAGIALLALLWLPVLKLPWAGSAALALSIGTSALAFAGLAAVAAQLAGTARGARGLAIAALGVAFVLRAVGDAGSAGHAEAALSWLSWASPLGWAEFARPFGSAGERWWALALPLAAGAAAVAVAFALAAWRDHSAGLLRGRPGRPAASGLLRGPFGLAWRLHAGVLGAWLAGYLFTFAALGAATKGVGSFLGTSATLKRYFLRIGYQHTIIDAYLTAIMLLAGLGAAAYATSAVLRLRTDETGNLAEPVLATATGRVRWALSHISVAVGGAGVLLAAAGLSAGLGYGVLAGSVGTQLPQLLAAALARVPAALVLAAVAAAVFGLLPWEATAVAWSVVALVTVIALFGPSLQWPAALMDISPYTQIPKLPGGAVTAEPLAWLCGIAVALGAAGLFGLCRRDLGDLGPSFRGPRIHDWLIDYLRIREQSGDNAGNVR